MIRPASPSAFRPVLLPLAAAALALALAGCGRKSGLDAPPGAAAEPAQQTASVPAWSTAGGGIVPASAAASPAKPAPPNKRIILDTLLD